MDKTYWIRLLLWKLFYLPKYLRALVLRSYYRAIWDMHENAAYSYLAQREIIANYRFGRVVARFEFWPYIP